MNKKIKTIALVAPCGNIKDYSLIKEKTRILEEKFKVKKYYSETPDSLNLHPSYLADTDENRAKYLTNAIIDNEVDLILNIRGGYGAIRIVDLINYNLINNSLKNSKKEKFYAGSSDASILLAALSKKTNIKCFHSLMLTNGFVDNLDKNIEIIENDTFNIPLEKINKHNNSSNNKIKGILWGGNLSSIVSIFPDNSLIPNSDTILFIEDLNEPLYKIDKMLHQIYRNQELKQKLKSIIFGDFYLPQEEITPLLKEYSQKFNINCYTTNSITHKNTNITIPYGKIIEL